MTQPGGATPTDVDPATGNDEDTTAQDLLADAVDGDDTDDAGADQLGDAGKKALDTMKGRWRAERDRRKALETQLAEATKAKTGDDKTQPDPDEIRRQAQADARAEVLRDRALDKVEARAAKLFADPEDARALLASQVDDFIDDGKVDVDAVDTALADLLRKKPHLAAAPARRFQGGADGGARNGSAGPAQLTEQDLKRMTPQQIEAARVAGQLNSLLGAS